jgi:crotonobetainyl-CoA:carnitine CoA-transferase CaiB-like acyl-CoA transferase
VRLDDGRPLRVPGSPFRFIGDEHPEERSPEERVTSYEPSDLTAARHRRGLEDESAPLPLAGLRVLDLTQVWAGPLAARLLADLGAEVICIEPPTGRGPAKVPRGSTAYRIGDGIDEPWNFQPLFNKLHRNRKSVCLNLKAPGARELFLELVRKSDVVIENFSPRAMSRLKLTYDHLRGVNSQIIYASLPAFGQHGPYGQYIGYGPGVEPMTGIAAILGYEGDQPRVSGTAITDPMGGMAGAAGVLTALDRRARTGEGSWVDLSQHEASIALFGEFFIERQLSGRESERLPNCHPRHAPHGVYPCTGDDNWIAIAARDEDEWLTLCAMAGRGWNTDPRFTGVERRRKHRGELNGVISSWTSQREHQALASALRGAGVPAGAVLRSSEYLVDPHLSARGYFAALEHPRTGEWPSDGSPMRFEGSRGYDQWTPPPTLGEHNVEVLEEILGLSRTQIERLHAEGVIADAPP